jgi:hypothetical protein
MFRSAECSLWGTEGFSRSDGVLYRGLGISELQFLINFYFYFWSWKPWIRIRNLKKCWIRYLTLKNVPSQRLFLLSREILQAYPHISGFSFFRGFLWCTPIILVARGARKVPYGNLKVCGRNTQAINLRRTLEHFILEYIITKKVGQAHYRVHSRKQGFGSALIYCGSGYGSGSSIFSNCRSGFRIRIPDPGFRIRIPHSGSRVWWPKIEKNL